MDYIKSATYIIYNLQTISSFSGEVICVRSGQCEYEASASFKFQVLNRNWTSIKLSIFLYFHSSQNFPEIVQVRTLYEEFELSSRVDNIDTPLHSLLMSYNPSWCLQTNLHRPPHKNTLYKLPHRPTSFILYFQYFSLSLISCRICTHAASCEVL